MLKHKEKSNVKVCAVIVTYNRKEVLKKCLKALLNQTVSPNEIIVIDGPSTDGTMQLMREKFSEITYVRLDEDVGGAGGFYEGMKLAYSKGYDWIWVMDDDAIPEKDALEKLLSAVDNDQNSIARPALVDAPGFAPWFAGGIFSRTTIKRIGLPLKELFIYCDDTEYLIRAEKAGMQIINVSDAKINHRDWFLRGHLSKKIFLRKTITGPIYPKGRKYYYIQRNQLYVFTLHRNWKVLLSLLTKGSAVSLVKYLLLGDPEKALAVIKGTIDYFLHKTGKSPWAHKH
jgi:rhamnopyranosyl-N-acetylglucosaminyl-diphospho-decaprenol beta-1,3/1,4-galactofuranosyltransferase